VAEAKVRRGIQRRIPVLHGVRGCFRANRLLLVWKAVETTEGLGAEQVVTDWDPNAKVALYRTLVPE
jgi:hypothetical protein